MPAHVRIENGVLRVLLEGEIDHHSARLMRETIDTAAEKCRPQKMILDFKGVTFMDSSGIGLILGRHQLMGSLGGTLEVVNPNRNVERMVRLAGVGRLGVIGK